MASTGGTQVLDRANALLDLVAGSGTDGLTLKELTARSGLHTATCHRILTALVGHRWLARDIKQKRYRLGTKMYVYGVRAAKGPGLISRCGVGLGRLRKRTGETTHLMTRNNHDSVCLDRRDGECVVQTLTGSIGGSVPLGVGPGSIAMLAFLDEEEQKFILRANTPRYAGFRDLPLSKVWRLLAETRERGHAIDVGELIPGIAGLAMPIRDQDGTAIASLGYTFLSVKATPAVLEQYGRLLRIEIDEIEH